MVRCRSCGESDLFSVLDLGTAPPSNAYLTPEQARGPEVWLPLRMNVCTSCWLMQTEDFVSGQDVFTDDYGYFSSMSESWLRHSHDFVQSAIERFSLGPRSLVVEVAANDGYLLQYVKAAGIPCVGIEPTHSTASAARDKGLPIEEVFLTQDAADDFVAKHGQADLVVANNVIAHVPDIVDFTRGLAALLKPHGSLSIEFAYGVDLVERGQFDTIYHEHFSYLTLTSLMDVLERAGLEAVDVQQLRSHGGSLRVTAKRLGSRREDRGGQLEDLIARECSQGVRSLQFYMGLQGVANRAKLHLLKFLIDASATDSHVAGYGAAAKGNTLLNFSGVTFDLLPFVVDKSPGKVGRLLPGSRIPVMPVSALADEHIDSVLILPWNLTKEVLHDLDHIMRRPWSAFTAVPDFKQVSVP